MLPLVTHAVRATARFRNPGCSCTCAVLQVLLLLVGRLYYYALSGHYFAIVALLRRQRLPRTSVLLVVALPWLQSQGSQVCDLVLQSVLAEGCGYIPSLLVLIASTCLIITYVAQGPQPQPLLVFGHPSFLIRMHTVPLDRKSSIHKATPCCWEARTQTLTRARYPQASTPEVVPSLRTQSYLAGMPSSWQILATLPCRF